MDEKIEGWTVETLRQHILAVLEEQDKRLEARFLSQEVGRVAAADEFSRYRSSNNEWRGALDDSRKSMVPREEWSSHHRQLEERLSIELRSRDQRIEAGDHERNSLRERLVKIESRAGYVSLGVVMSGISLLVAIAVAIVSVVHLGPH